MSRNFYILAAALAFFALLSAGMTLVPSNFQPGLPAQRLVVADGGVADAACGLACALIGVMSNLFEQGGPPQRRAARETRDGNGGSRRGRRSNRTDLTGFKMQGLETRRRPRGLARLRIR